MKFYFFCFIFFASCMSQTSQDMQEGLLPTKTKDLLRQEILPEPPGILEIPEESLQSKEDTTPSSQEELVQNRQPTSSSFLTLKPDNNEGPKGDTLKRLEWWFKKADQGLSTWEPHFNQVEKNGKIPKVPYQEATHLLSHLRVVRHMTRAYVNEPRVERLTLIQRALHYFLLEDKGDPENWWFASIGLPLELGPILLQLGTQLPLDLQKPLALKLPLLAQQPSFAKTGANLLWIGTIQLMRACIEKKITLAEEVVELFKRSTLPTKQGQDGIKLDGSLHQHGAMIHNGTYGYYYLQSFSEAARLFQDTPLAFDDSLLLNLASLTLSSAWMSRGLRWDSSVVGRELTRYLGESRGLWNIFQNLQRSAKKQESFRGIHDELVLAMAENPTQSRGLKYSKHFWNSDYYVHHRPHFGVTVRTVSSRTIGTEAGNQDNKLGFWLPFGLKLLTTSGRDYDTSIFSWNFARLPGVTNPDKLYAFQQFSNQFENQTQTDSLVFGLSTNGIGLSAMKLGSIRSLLQEQPDGKTTKERLGLIHQEYQKAWFFTDLGVITLINEIRSKEPERVHSTLDQIATPIPPKIGNQPATLDGAPLLGKPGEMAQIGPRLYIPLDDSLLTISYNTQTREWSTLGASSPTGEKIFKEPQAWIRIDHGVRPSSKKAAFMNAILSNQQSREAIRKSVQVISNTASISSIFLPTLRVSLSAFWKPASLQTPDVQVEVSKPCGLYIQATEKGFDLAISSPQTSEIQITLSTKEKSRTSTWTPPSGSNCGKTERVQDFEIF
jgi:chondroitin AC lyase